MLKNLFTFQAGTISPIAFIPVIEKQMGEGDEVFIRDYPVKILLSGDLELVPWMVGITSKEGGIMSKSEAIFLYKINYYISLNMETE
jgi:hypothetical protein